jgi:alpha-galactosidase
MRKTGLLLLLLLVTGRISLFSQDFFRWNGTTLTLDNGCIQRTIIYNKDSLKLATSQLLLKAGGYEAVKGQSAEFSFQVNGNVFNGLSGWMLVSCVPASDNHSGKGATIRMSLNDSLEVEITYLLYPGLPLIRKTVSLSNHGKRDVCLEALNIEDLNTRFNLTSTWIYQKYARQMHIGNFDGNWDDALVIFHDNESQAGMVVGNEMPGVLKRIAYHLPEHVTSGTTLPGQDFPFRKWLKPGESWTSPATFVALYKSTDAAVVLNTTVNDYVRKYMGTRLSQVDSKPLFVYNTWYPFRTFVNDSLVRDIARAAADCGIQEFIIDDGWQVNDRGKTSDRPWGGNYGDWLVDRQKFPGDLKSTFDYIRSLGMKPGLWISIGSATADSKVFREHPAWFVKNYRNKPGNLHFVADSSDFYTSCFGTEWFGYIKKVILDMVKEHGLAYAKLDLSVVTSAYVEDPRVSGCYDNNHPFHRDREESYIVIYERVLKLFDELHEEAPSLFIDCTFETEGKLQLQDYAFAMHADGNWLSNFEEDFPVGALRVRQMAWWRTPSMPASSLVIGNQAMDNKDFIFSLKSLVGTLPIVLGDPRKLSPQQRVEIKRWSDWMVLMQKEYDYMSFRQDLPGFGEPAAGSWDGWQRINTDTKKGGIIGVFRQGAMESSRTVFITGLAPDKTYTIRLAPDNIYVIEASGKSLAENGFQVVFERMTDGNLYEITMNNEN